MMSDTTPANREVIYSAMQATGKLHLGNYEGALRNWVRLQHDYEFYAGIVDLHSLTTTFDDTSSIVPNVRDVAIDYLAAGIDPEITPIVVQSWVPAHSELHVLLSMITPIGWLERVPTYKEKREQLHISNPSYGLLGYPVLMAADIMVYRANAVPVGRDQVPHLELTREIVRRFNNFYGPVFPEPKTLLTEAKRIPGTDGRKMSKSYGNAIYLKDEPETLRQKLRPMLTDPARQRRTDAGNPEICPVFDLHKAFSTQETQDWAAAGCRSAGIGCLDCKGKLTEHMLERLAPLHARRSDWEKRPGDVWQILVEGSRRARLTAQATMDEVRGAMKIRY